jgi:hypothetical protein
MFQQSIQFGELRNGFLNYKMQTLNDRKKGISKLMFFSLTLIINIKMDLLGVALNVVDRNGLAQDRYRWRALVNSVMKLRVP